LPPPYPDDSFWPLLPMYCCTFRSWWWELLLLSLLEKWCSNWVRNYFVFSYLASHSEWRCLRCLSFYRWWKTESIHIDLALSIWGPTLFSTHAPPSHPVPAGPLISWSKNASWSQIPPRASRASPPPKRWAMTRCRLSLRTCTAPLFCSLQPLLKLLLLSLGPSVLQFVSIVSLLLNHENLTFEPVCVFLPFPLLPLLFWSKWISALSPCLQFGRYHHSDSTITFNDV